MSNSDAENTSSTIDGIVISIETVGLGEPPDPLGEHARWIVSIAQHEDRLSFGLLFSAYGPKLKGYLLRLGVDEQRAEEVAQETMLMVWRKAGHFDPARASAAAWIFTIARNLRVDMLRRDHKPASIWTADSMQEPPTPEQVLGAAQGDRQFLRAVAHLPPECTEVLRLSFFEDRSHSQIAEVLRVPLGTVKSRLRRAFERLRTILAD